VIATPAAVQPIRVLLVEDNPGDARLILELLREAESYEFDMERVDGLEAALDRLTRAGVDVVLLDLGLPDSQGLETFRRARRRAPDEAIVVISGLNDEQVALEAVRSGAQDYLVKGRIEGDLLARVIRYAIERKRADEALRAREAHYRTILENIGDGVFIADREGRHLDVNPRACELTGYSREELLRIGIADTYPPEEREAAAGRLAEIAAGRLQFYERPLLRKDGGVILVETNARVLPDGRLLSTVRDITERRSLEEQLRHAQKMEAVGRLAGGVAHDFNNVLSVIFGNLDLMAEDLPADSVARQDLQEVNKAAHRAAALTRQLLAFSRRQVLQPVVLSLNDLLRGIDKMLHRLIAADVELRLTLAPGLGNVRADPGQVEQVVMNLVVNARDAMPTGGKLLIETANSELTEQYAEGHQQVTAGAYVMLAVTDTGTGMDRETMGRIFEPFFTTKEQGKGTGLGLSTVYGIVKQSGGYIWVYSEPGRGTAMKVYLPRVDAAPQRQAPPRDTGALTGIETVLLAEDDEMLRPLSKVVLQKFGYTVLEASNAAEALTIARDHPGPIHLLLADVVMPGGSGRELARQLAEYRPDTRVLYVSGYTDDAVIQHGMLEPGLAFLQKPFTPSVLARKVRETLDSA
jgi:PAS domain S-box-containing protein